MITSATQKSEKTMIEAIKVNKNEAVDCTIKEIFQRRKVVGSFLMELCYHIDPKRIIA